MKLRVSTMIELNNNHRHRQRRCTESRRAQKNFTSLLASSNLKQWIIILFLFYKLDYKDYYCYGSSSSSSSAILNNENGKVPFSPPSLCWNTFPSFFIFHSLSPKSICYPSELPSSYPLQGWCFMPFALILACCFIFKNFFLMSCLSWRDNHLKIDFALFLKKQEILNFISNSADALHLKLRNLPNCSRLFYNAKKLSAKCFISASFFWVHNFFFSIEACALVWKKCEAFQAIHPNYLF